MLTCITISIIYNSNIFDDISNVFLMVLKSFLMVFQIIVGGGDLCSLVVLLLCTCSSTQSVRTHTHTYTHTHTHTLTHSHTYTHSHIHTHTHAHTHAHTHTHTHTCMYMCHLVFCSHCSDYCIHIYMHVHVYVHSAISIPNFFSISFFVYLPISFLLFVFHSSLFFPFLPSIPHHHSSHFLTPPLFSSPLSFPPLSSLLRSTLSPLTLSHPILLLLLLSCSVLHTSERKHVRYVLTLLRIHGCDFPRHLLDHRYLHLL